MYDQPEILNAVAAIRVSTTKQGVDGDSPEAQREQIEQFAANRNIKVKKVFVYLESASQEQQPIQEAIDYCKKRKNGIQLFIVKSIDRFTRGGSYSYSNLKMQLDKAGVRLMDIYGIIGTRKVNTLEHLGLSYKWSVYDPTKNSEILEAERAHDEKRDIMSRMIGAEIRYARLGYWVRRPPIGYTNATAETINGKRCVLEPHPVEGYWIKQMFELRARGTLDDHQIVDSINGLGFKTRVMYARDKQDRTRITARTGGNLLTVKGLWRYVKSPIYAGVMTEKWTNGRPVKAKFPGLVSIELFNNANRGKLVITEAAGEIKIIKRQPREDQLRKGAKAPEFPFRRVVMCPECSRPLCGSFSRGQLGKHYPGYHCSNRGHYFRVPRQVFDQTIKSFVGRITVADEFMPAIIDTVVEEWAKRNQIQIADQAQRTRAISALSSQARLAAEKIKFLDPGTIKYIENEIRNLETEIERLKSLSEAEVDFKRTEQFIRVSAHHILKRPDKLLLNQSDPTARANCFGALFNSPPTYQELVASANNNNPLAKVARPFHLTA